MRRTAGQGGSLGGVTDDDLKGLRQRLQSGSEEALGKLAQELLENPLITGALIGGGVGLFFGLIGALRILFAGGGRRVR